MNNLENNGQSFKTKPAVRMQSIVTLPVRFADLLEDNNKKNIPHIIYIMYKISNLLFSVIVCV